MKLSDNDLSLLEECIRKNNSLHSSLIDSRYLYNLSREDYNVLREMVCDELITEGFEDGEITQYGIKLENLIDTIGRIFMQ